MSKKNNLSLRRKQHEFDLRREKEDREKKEKKLQANKNKMKVEGKGMKKKNKRMGAAGGFQVGKRKVKTKLTALAKARVAQAMELDS
ncbi:hypothetical protein MLD38_010593 [Melastoma candidum]|uniref:Uncharacterized protein n=1 Tax=Melastoma candidum TaxID=119954 RepID=A0ACB9R3F4_9MYRT|nr:hypothetical protein MLD38_010593 [Melastoma candidum]